MKKQSSNLLLLMSVIATLLCLLTACEHEHSFGEWTVEQNATCTENGNKVRFCECGVKQSEIIYANGHVAGEWIIDTEATCTESGSKHQVCSVCAETVKTVSISPKGHASGEWVIDAEATCTESGSKHQVCSVCAETVKTVSISPKGHASGEWVIDAEATCTESGSKHQVCSVCAETITEIIYAKGHKWTDATCSAPSMCSICGLTQGTNLNHNFISGKCSFCGQSDIVIINTYGSERQYVAYYYAFSTGRLDVKGTGYIEEFTYDGNKLKVVVSIVQSGTFGFNYKITDSNGITVENSYMMEMNAAAGEKYILETRLNLAPGEYEITFSSRDALS
jgi:hypothetical protein